jgi:PAS domain S-box-containing protein
MQGVTCKSIGIVIAPKHCGRFNEHNKIKNNPLCSPMRQHAMSNDANSREWQEWIEAIPHVVWAASDAGDITFLNGQWTEMTGLSCEQGLGFEFLQAIHAEDRDRIQVSWQQAVASRQPYEAKFRLRQANGEYCRVIARAQVQRPKDSSQTLEWVGTFTNIESVVYCKDDLVHKQQFLEALLENLSDGIVACDASGTLTLFNAASQTFHGLPAEPLPAERWAEHYDLYDADRAVPMRQEEIPLFRALKGERVRGTKMRIVPKHGKARILISSGAPIMHPDGHQLGAVVAMRDITEQEQAEAALKDSERRFRAIFNQTFQFIGLLEPDGTLIEANQTALDFGGLTAAAVIGKPFWEARWWGLSQEVQMRLQQAIAQAAAGEFVRYEVEVLGANDKIMSIDFSLKPIADEVGNTVLLIAEGRDITLRKQAEAEVHRLNTSLGERVVQRTAELEAKNYQNELLLVSAQEAKAEAEVAIAQTASYTERLTLALEAAQMGTWDWDMDTDRTLWDLRHEAIFGYEPGTPNRDYFDWEHRVHPDDLEWIHQATHAARDNRHLLTIQYRILWPDGSLHWIDASGRFLYDAAGKPIRMIGVVRDITANKQTEDALRQEEARYRCLLEATSQIIWNTHAEGELVAEQPSWSRFTGQSFEECKGWGWLNAIHPDDQQATVKAWTEALSTRNTYRIEHRIRRYDGEYRDMHARGVPVLEEDGTVREWVGTHSDITEQKQYAEALRQSQEQFRATFEQAAVGIAHVDLNGGWLRVNQKLCDIVGYSEAELTGRTFQDITHPDDLEADLAHMRQLLAAEIQTYAIEKRYFHKSGEAVWIELTVSLVREEPEDQHNLAVKVGKPKYFISVIEEINDRKQAKAELEARSRELSQFNGLLAQAAVLLDERNQELDRFVHIVSHDLKAPLRAISNLSQWIEEDLEGKLSVENQQQMTLLRDRVHRMQIMIDGLLEYARAGRTEADLEPVAVTELLAEVIDSLDPPSTFKIEIAPEMPILQTKRLPLSQVFANLISNGVKHHPRPDGLIQISSQDKGDFYEFAVADDGPGIAPEHHEKIFMIFQAVNPQNSQDSSGIGLSIVKKIVETEEGTIRLASEAGKGTTFYFTWPKQPEAIASSE